MKPLEHQDKISDIAYNTLKQYMIVYLAMEERTGKTLTSILTAEKCNNVCDILVITKKKALEGWQDTINKYKPSKNYTVTNYHQAHKLNKRFDLVIIDEAHEYISGFPKPSSMWKQVAIFTKDVPIIYLSATPSSQSLSMLYHQFKLSSWSPFLKWNTFSKWFKEFGIEAYTYTPNGKVRDYKKTKKDLVKQYCQHLFISFTRQELGFEFEPEDVLHYVDLTDSTKKLYKQIDTDGYAIVNDTEVVAQTPMEVLLKLHQIEGGTLKFENSYMQLPNTEKIDYIKKTFGDTKDIVIFYNYKEELNKLKTHFKNATILQATTYAEGVDLSMFETLIIYSMNFSTAKYTQRRARQANFKRDTPIKVHFLLCKNMISDYVYKCVAINKKNFVDKYYKELKNG